jgi:tetratricopeptide (TPR) repeat protein
MDEKKADKPKVNLLQKTGITAKELKILIIAAIISTVVTIVFIGFMFFNIKLSEKKAKTTKQTHLLGDPQKIQNIDLDAHKRTAEYYIRTNDFEKAIPHLERILSISAKDRITRTKFGSALLETGQYDAALEQFEMLQMKDSVDSLSSRICSRKAITLFYLGKIEESETTLNQCIQSDSSNAEAFCFRGQIEATRSLPSEKALTDLHKAILLDSSYIEARYQLARYYMSMQSYDTARLYLLEALDIDPLHEKSHSRLGMVYYYLNEFELARKSCLTALALNPEDFNTLYNLGEVYYSNDDTARAMKYFMQAVKHNPGHVEANFKLGILLLMNNQVKEALFRLEQANKNSPDNIRIMHQLAVAYEKMRMLNDALMVYKKIIEINDSNPIAREKIKLLTESQKAKE